MIPGTFLLLVLPSIFGMVLGKPHIRGGRHRHRPRNAEISLTTPRVFVLEDFYKGKSFLTDWSLFSAHDPTHGLVNYQTREKAISKRLAYVDGSTTVLAVDDFSHIAVGAKRDSVRITSKKRYNGGLFIADFESMPHGCSVWPAYWSVGDIDVVEGVHNGPTNLYTLHTSSGCSMSPVTDLSTRSKFKSLSKLNHASCGSSGKDNRGCGFSDPDPSSYGQQFNNGNGGVFAHLWDSTGIRIWRFQRSDIPKDIRDHTPNPASWGIPAAFFPSGSNCDMKKHFFDHSLVIDTTLCGDFGNSTFGRSGCKGTCAQAVTNPANFKLAKWRINYIAVYQ
ncbi:hypothetical protein CPC08DRAFT_737146 [Agrocybe pediades]|nr:hypothetical protein CPC08DRAFT_737146 [Agrocybe pediades]